MEKKIKHLEMIQQIINRLANTSFLLKGWGVTLLLGLFVLVADSKDIFHIIIAYFAFCIFWFLDAYFLSQERLYRALYDKVRKLEDDQVDFSMKTIEFYKKRNTWLLSLFSKTLCVFYLPFIIIITILIFLI